MSSVNEGEAAVERVLRRADEETAAGRPWRAKEILGGAVRSFSLDVRLLEAYGRLLDRLGDRVEAGKYVFLSGVRGPDVDEAIQLFISRHGKGHLNNLVARFPRLVRSLGVSQLPPVVEADLKALGLPESFPRDQPIQQVVEPPGWRQSLSMLGCAVVSIVLLVASIVGLVVIVRWLLGLAGG